MFQAAIQPAEVLKRFRDQQEAGVAALPHGAGDSQRPSDLVDIVDRWAALQFDNAVTLVGGAIEDAAQEQQQVGTKKEPKWQAKYHMEQLLDEDFRLPRPPTMKERERSAIQGLLGWAAMSGGGVKVFKQKKAEQ